MLEQPGRHPSIFWVEVRPHPTGTLQGYKAEESFPPTFALPVTVRQIGIFKDSYPARGVVGGSRRWAIQGPIEAKRRA